MTPLELQAALARTPARSAQVLSHRLLDAKTREECAALYSVPLDAWDVLFLRAARDFDRAIGRAPPAGDEAAEASRLATTLTPELTDLSTHREELKRLIDKAHADYEASPAYARESWARKVAIAVIIGLTLYFYWRDEQSKKALPYAPYLTEPKKK